MESTVEKSLKLAMRATRGVECQDETVVQTERMIFEMNDSEEREEKSGTGESRRERRCRRGKRWRLQYSTASIINDMTISRSCRHSFSAPVMFWTTVFLILLARGVYSISDEQSRYSRSPKYDQDVDVQGGYITPNAQETYNVVHFIRELIQRQQQQRANQQQLQLYNNGEDLSENQMDWRKVPLPVLNQIRSIINDGSKEEDKRGSYISLCHFKICNMG